MDGILSEMEPQDETPGMCRTHKNSKYAQPGWCSGIVPASEARDSGLDAWFLQPKIGSWDLCVQVTKEHR